MEEQKDTGTVAPEQDIFPLEGLGLITKTVGEDQRVVYPKCAENCNRLLQNHPDFAGRLRFDEFTQEAQYRDDTGKWGRITDETHLDLQSKIQSLYPQFSGYGLDLVSNAINFVSSKNRVDTAKDWIRSLEWDGENRLENFCEKAYGVERTIYHDLVGKNFLLGIAARVLMPGCHHRSVLILEGEQNIKKSKSFRELVPSGWFVEDAPLPTDSVGFFMTLWGKLVVEFSEGVIFSRIDMGKIKGLVSTPVDTLVKKWGRNPIDIPRRCVFVITTNQSEYFTDRTGNTRFFPVKVKEVNLDWIRDNRDQLFAEARVRVEQGEPWWNEENEANETFKEEQERRVVNNVLEEKVHEWIADERRRDFAKYKNLDDGFRLTDVLDSMMNGRYTRRDEMEASEILKKLGFVKERRLVGNIRSVFWIKSDNINKN